MSEDAPPPVILAHTRVVAYALVDDTIEFTGKLHLYSGDKRLGRVPRLAVCQSFDEKEWLLVHCDEHWDVIGVQSWNASEETKATSLDDVKTRAERYYRGLTKNWITHPASPEEAHEYFEGVERSQACSFCGKGPSQITSLIESPTARICNECIVEFYKEMVGGNQ